MNVKFTTAALLLFAALPFAAHADLPGHHPAYLHALTDLRDARWNLEHRPGDLAVTIHETKAIAEIDLAIEEAKRAAADDAKNLADRPHEDAHLDRPGRLHHAAELLRKAHGDVDQEEDNPQSRELKHRVLHHIDEALHATERAIHDVEHGH
jgi:hypothetical protein